MIVLLLLKSLIVLSVMLLFTYSGLKDKIQRVKFYPKWVKVCDFCWIYRIAIIITIIDPARDLHSNIFVNFVYTVLVIGLISYFGYRWIDQLT